MNFEIIIANMFDNIIQNITNANKSYNYALNATEFALGYPITTHTITIGLGFNIINYSDFSFLPTFENVAISGEKLFLGHGYCVTGNQILNVYNNTNHSLQEPNIKPISYNTYIDINYIVYDIKLIDKLNQLINNIPLINTYAFGNIYLKYIPDENTIKILYDFYKPSITGKPLLIYEDIDISTIKYWLNNDYFNIINENSDDFIIKLYDFALHIKQLNVKNKDDLVYIFLSDKRNCCGWCGLTQEKIFVNLISYIIKYKNNFNKYLTSLCSSEYLDQNNLSFYIWQWIQAPYWQNMYNKTFQQYWQEHSDEMPFHLKQYIKDIFGIIV